jgi:hypothetical protein
LGVEEIQGNVGGVVDGGRGSMGTGGMTGAEGGGLVLSVEAALTAVAVASAAAWEASGNVGFG